jgi:xanthine dehydrogenase accessory factor
MKRAILEELIVARRAKVPVALITLLDSGTQAIVQSDKEIPQGEIDEKLVAAARLALARDRSTMVETESGHAFIQVLMPPRRLFIIGAVHIAQYLAPMAALAGYEVSVVDPRRAFATDERFPSVNMVKEWPDRALARLRPDRYSAIVALTHDPKLDEPALKAALTTDAFYIGALGSKQTQTNRRERLAQAGFGEEVLARIHGPVGLNLGAKTPAEIAVAILAEITQVLRQDGTTQRKDATVS